MRENSFAARTAAAHVQDWASFSAALNQIIETSKTLQSSTPLSPTIDDDGSLSTLLALAGNDRYRRLCTQNCEMSSNYG